MSRSSIAAVFEGLVRARALAVLEHDKALERRSRQLIDLHFTKGTPLHAEAAAFASLSSAHGLERSVAERAIDETISRVSKRRSRVDLSVLASDASDALITVSPSKLAEAFDGLIDAIDEGPGGVVELASARKRAIDLLCENVEMPGVDERVDSHVVALAERRFVEKHGEHAPILIEWATGSPSYLEKAKEIVLRAKQAISEYSLLDEATSDVEMSKRLSEVKEIASNVDLEKRESIADVLLLADLTKEIRR